MTMILDSNIERSSKRASKELAFLASDLTDSLGWEPAISLYQYCRCCCVNYYFDGAVDTFLIPNGDHTSLDEGNIYATGNAAFAKWCFSRFRRRALIVDEITEDSVAFRTRDAEIKGYTELEVSPQQFVEMLRDVHRYDGATRKGHTPCRHDWQRCDRPKCRDKPYLPVVEGLSQHFNPYADTLRMRLSSLVRAVPKPVGHIDTDLLMVDSKTGKPKLIVEESHDESKASGMTRALGEKWKVPSARVITHDDDIAEVTIHGPDRFVTSNVASYEELVTWLENFSNKSSEKG